MDSRGLTGRYVSVNGFRFVTLRDDLQATLGDTYTLERELTGGGMARVFVAEERALGRQVVVKVLPSETAAGVSIERFKREISLAARLQHPHIVPLLSAGAANGLPYFTMPYVEGESLRVRLTHHGELPLGDATRLLREIASALAYAHERGIVHRDIKPDNVLLSGGSAMVTDFGVAKALSASSNDEHGNMTSLGVALGTPAYMSPEQATADPAIDHRADIYAFGVLAYEALTGHPPFVGRTPQNLLAAHVSEPPENITRRRAGVPPALAALIMRCLEKRPADRPQTSIEIVRALDDLTTPSGGIAPTSAHTPSVARPVAASMRSWAIVAVAVVGVSALAWSKIARGRNGADTAITSVAVLPFVNTSGDTTVDYLVDGIADQVRTDLVGLGGLKVSGRTSSLRFAGNKVDVHEAGSKLGATAVVTGSVARHGVTLRVTAELVNAADGSTMWSGTFERPATEISKVQDSIVHQLSGALRVSPTQQAVSGSDQRGTTDDLAFDLYLRGMRATRANDFRSAISLLTQAVTRDPRFARAYGALSLAYTILAGSDQVSQDSVSALARSSLEHALALDSTSADGVMAKLVMLGLDWRFAELQAAAAAAIVRFPENADILSVHAFMLATAGDLNGAIRDAQMVVARDPLNPGRLIALQYFYYTARRFREATDITPRILEVDSTSVLASGAYENVMQAYLFRGKPDSGLIAAKQSVRLAPHFWGGRIWTTLAYAAAGQWKDADRERVLAERDSSLNSPNVGRAYIHISFAAFDSAVTDLERAVARRELLVTQISMNCDPLFDPLKSNPRFGELIRKMGWKMCPASGAWPIPRR